jgi:cytoskeletal protein RodZ
MPPTTKTESQTELPSSFSVAKAKDSISKEDKSDKVPKKKTNKFFAVLLISFLVIAFSLVTFWLVQSRLARRESLVINPFADSAETKNPFDVKTSNPFSENSSTNPFASGKEKQEYANPFEKLR